MPRKYKHFKNSYSLIHFQWFKIIAVTSHKMTLFLWKNTWFKHMDQTSSMVTFSLSVIQSPSSSVSLVQAHSNMINVIWECVLPKDSQPLGQHNRPGDTWPPSSLYLGELWNKTVPCEWRAVDQALKNVVPALAHFNHMKGGESLCIPICFSINWRVIRPVCLTELLWESNEIM